MKSGILRHVAPQNDRRELVAKLEFTGYPLTSLLSFWTKWRISSLTFFRELRTRFFVTLLLRMTGEN